jgi:lysozyme family protein
MDTNFKTSLAFVLKWEGGNDDDPQDPGGRTSRGIEQREYDAWCELHKSPSGDVWKCSDATIEVIYYHSYWLPYCDPLPLGLDLMFFDANVNQGIRESTLFLQRALGVSADGHFGIVTMAAVKRLPHVKDLINQIDAERNAYYRSLRTFQRFGKGWMNRLADCVATAQKMAV